jgi:BASS family bile acid:Na+ symporter
VLVSSFEVKVVNDATIHLSESAEDTTQSRLQLLLMRVCEQKEHNKFGSIRHMSAIVSKYPTPLVVVLSIVLGLFLPQIGLIWKPYLAVLLMLLMFSVTISIEPHEIARSMRNYPVVSTSLFTVFVLTPLLSLLAKPFFSPIIYAGTVLALCCPAAIASAFWVKVFKGDIATALVISTITNLLSIATIPGTMLIAVGTAVNVDTASMIVNLGEIIIIPITVSFLLRRFVHMDWNRVISHSFKIELALLVLLIWGSIAPGAEYARNNIMEFALLNVFMLAVLSLAFILTHFLTRKFGYKKATSIEIATTVKNAALSLVIGLSAFGPQILPPLIANLIAQNLLLLSAKALTNE